jgi:flagellar biosynthesis chaperone FliJ
MQDETTEENVEEENEDPTGEDTGAQSEAETSEAKFTQDDLDNLAGKTRKVATSKARKALLEELGVSNLSDAKAALKQLGDLKEAQMSDAEKAQAQIEKANDELTAVRAEMEALKKMQAQEKQARILEAALRKAGAENPDDLMLILGAKKADEIAAIFADEFDEKALAGFVSEAQKSYAIYFKTASGGSPSSQSGVPPTKQVAAAEEAAKHIQNIINA